MAVVYPGVRAHGHQYRATVNLSTNADGVTGADVVDAAGLAFSGIEVWSTAPDANYTVLGGYTTALLQRVVKTTGDAWVFGSTVAGVTAGHTICVDPGPFAGLRFIQLALGTSASPIAGTTGLTAGVLFSPLTQSY